MQRIEANAIDKFGRPLDVPDRKIAVLAALKRADVAAAFDFAKKSPFPKPDELTQFIYPA